MTTDQKPLSVEQSCCQKDLWEFDSRGGGKDDRADKFLVSLKAQATERYK